MQNLRQPFICVVRRKSVSVSFICIVHVNGCRIFKKTSKNATRGYINTLF